MGLNDNFKCRLKRGDGRCGRDACRCTPQKCDKRYSCVNCTASIIPLSQEPCASCYFRNKESMRLFALQQERRNKKHVGEEAI